MRQTQIISLLSLTVILLLSGCAWLDQPVPVQQQPQSQPEAPVQQDNTDIQRRFESGREQNGDAVQNAVMWANKYEALSLTNNELREKNNKLFTENTRLKQDVDRLTMQLEQTRKDLKEANEFLQQMHVELSKWKTDVLGFREEMRQAQRAQLEALSKVLRVLGAEPAKIPDSLKNSDN